MKGRGDQKVFVPSTPHPFLMTNRQALPLRRGREFLVRFEKIFLNL
jgi:hypothetical protein